MGYFSKKMVKFVASILFMLVVGLAFLRVTSIVFPAVPAPSATFDCDDSTLAMYRHFQSLGIESVPIIGNLKMNGEAYMESNHVWLLVKTGDGEIAYDWGTPRFDRQHYEGYTISLDYLRGVVEQDLQAGGTLASADQ
jgi:hypothetical protein